MSDACVLDASAALALLAASQTTIAAQTFFLDPSNTWHAPALFRLEVRNALHRLERRGVLDVGHADERLMLLEGQIRFERPDDHAQLSRTVACARAVGLSVYDATYLETAIRLGAALASRDVALLDAAEEGGVTTVDLR